MMKTINTILMICAVGYFSGVATYIMAERAEITGPLRYLLLASIAAIVSKAVGL